MPPQGHEGNNSEVAQDQHVSDNPDCGDTQDRGAKNINIDDNQDDMAAKQNPTEVSYPTEDGKSTDEDVCGSLDDWLQNPTPFGAELEVRFFCVFIFCFLILLNIFLSLFFFFLVPLYV